MQCYAQVILIMCMQCTRSAHARHMQERGEDIDLPHVCTYYGYRLTMATLTMGAFLEVLLDAHALVTTLTTLTTPYYTCYAYYLAALTTDPTRCRTPTRP